MAIKLSDMRKGAERALIERTAHARYELGKATTKEEITEALYWYFRMLPTSLTDPENVKDCILIVCGDAFLQGYRLGVFTFIEKEE